MCNRLRIAQRSLRRSIDNLERWLPPGPHLGNPPVNSEYFFDGGLTWELPVDFFRGFPCNYSLNHSSAAYYAYSRYLPRRTEADLDKIKSGIFCPR